MTVGGSEFCAGADGTPEQQTRAASVTVRVDRQSWGVLPLRPRLMTFTSSSIDLKPLLSSKRDQARLDGEADDSSGSAFAAGVVDIHD